MVKSVVPSRQLYEVDGRKDSNDDEALTTEGSKESNVLSIQFRNRKTGWSRSAVEKTHKSSARDLSKRYRI